MPSCYAPFHTNLTEFHCRRSFTNKLGDFPEKSGQCERSGFVIQRSRCLYKEYFVFVCFYRLVFLVMFFFY